MLARNEQRARRLLGHLSPDVEESYGPGQKAGVAGPGILLHQDSIAATYRSTQGHFRSTQGHQTGVLESLRWSTMIPLLLLI